MSAENIAKTIQLILAPAVMITACAILLGGLLGRYETINTRLRGMGHERFELLRTVLGGSETERLQELDRQIPDLLHRYRLQHEAITIIYGAIVVFVINMFVIALAILTETTWSAGLALLVFLSGMVVYMLGVLRAGQEIRISQRAVAYEVGRITALQPASRADSPIV